MVALEDAADRVTGSGFDAFMKVSASASWIRTVLIKALKPLCVIATREGFDGLS
ncbi:MAG: hypothetical protein CM15mP103_02790 [Gammaproteobacteria bacterium]|nr:MAG: hypothetical protein CM15mP103_02790 [Gammaproteobacteria bacterium]